MYIMYFIIGSLCFQMDEVDLANFTTISDANGEISKSDLIVHTKASSFWHN